MRIPTSIPIHLGSVNFELPITWVVAIVFLVFLITRLKNAGRYVAIAILAIVIFIKAFNIDFALPQNFDELKDMIIVMWNTIVSSKPVQNFIQIFVDIFTKIQGQPSDLTQV